MDFSPSETHLPKFKVETCFLSILLISARACGLGPGTYTLHAEGDDPEESEMEGKTIRTHPCENGRLSQTHAGFRGNIGRDSKAALHAHSSEL